MIYAGQLRSTKLLETLIPFFWLQFTGLRFTELSSDWSNGYFHDFHAKFFKKSNFSFCHSLRSVHSDKQRLVQKYCFSFLVFHIEIECTDIEVTLTRKCIQCNAKSTSL